MKNRIVAVLLAAAALLTIFAVAWAAFPRTEPVDLVAYYVANDEIIEEFKALGEDVYGGCYYNDDNTLTINVVGDLSQMELPACDPAVVKVNSVEYSYAFLSEAQDYLDNYIAPRGVECGIKRTVVDVKQNRLEAMLNEEYPIDPEIIKTLMEEKFGQSDFLNIVEDDGAGYFALDLAHASPPVGQEP